MSPYSNDTFAPFAALPAVSASPARPRWGFAQLFLTPFRDVDDRPARHAAASKAEREARQSAVSAAAGQRRR